ncbi:MAG: acyl-CoA dehydrogenase family protein [bacterium]|nr:acyl-CoA dehydrogenase family protein [bacterium]MDD3804626.1 acyl-CoA dehydrogenase family protein [bacterium]MDD4152888.1 acyl-CoA dehydrogenase family protein [bacterium]MDD4557375.1 acyl-CoA dehydrogenase family protein [bacterium]
MNFNLSEEQQMIMEMVKEYADGVLKPRAREVDESGEMPWDNIRQMAEMDLMGIPIPEEYGGAGLDFTTWAMVGEEISRACTTTGAVFGADMLCIYPIYFFGTEEQKKKYLVPLAKGEVVGAFGLTEPNAGSDAGNVRTRAVDAGDHYLLNGSKVFITNAGEADIYVIIANMDINKGARGLTAFIVEKGTPGFEIGKNEKKMAYSSLPNRELIFTDCKVPKENLLGKEKRGFRVALETLGVGRIGMGIGAVGLAQAALDEALEYSKVRVQFGKPISSFELIQAMLADMATEVDASRLLVLRAAFLKDQGMSYEKEAAMAKLFASETAMRTTTKAVQIHGGYGYTKEYTVERLMREAKLFEIVEGTSEIQRLVIANHLLR